MPRSQQCTVPKDTPLIVVYGNGASLRHHIDYNANSAPCSCAAQKSYIQMFQLTQRNVKLRRVKGTAPNCTSSWKKWSYSSDSQAITTNWSICENETKF